MSNITPRFLVSGTPGETEKVTTTAVATALSDEVKYKDGDPTDKEGKNLAKAVKITCETNPIRYAFNVDPTQDGGTGLGHVLAAGDETRLKSWGQIDGFKHITKSGTDHGDLQITPEF